MSGAQYSSVGWVDDFSDYDDRYIQKATIQLPGDLITIDSVTQEPISLPAGPNGWVLSANSALNTGLEWIAPPNEDIQAGTSGAETGTSGLTIATPAANITTLALANSGVVAGTYGSATEVPVITVDARGRLTGVVNTAISGANALDSVATRNWGAGTGRNVGTADNIVVGDTSTSAGQSRNVVLGSASSAAASDVVSIGYLVTCSGGGAISIGRQANTTVAAINSCAIGRQAVATGDACISIGYLSGTALVSGARCILIGQQATANTGAVDAIAIGSNAIAGGNFSIAIGSGANIGTDGVSIGGFTNAARNTLGGILTVSSAANSTMWGYNQRSSGSLSIICGYNNGRDPLTGTGNVIYGHTIAQLTLTSGTSNTLVGQNVNVTAANTSSAVGIGSNVTVASSAVCIGPSASANSVATTSVAIGSTASVTAQSAIAIGAQSKASSVFSTVVGFNAGSSTNAGNNCTIVGQAAGTTINGNDNSLFGANAQITATRVGNTLIGANVVSLNADNVTILGANSTASGANSSAIGYDVDNTTANTTRIGSNKSSAHIVDSEGLFRSVNQVHCVAEHTAEVVGAGPTRLTLSTTLSSYPAGLVSTADDWIWLSDVGLEALGRTYTLTATIRGTASASNNRWRATMFVSENGIGTRAVAFGTLCSSVVTDCAVSLAAVVNINPATISRPSFYVELLQTAGAGTITVNVYWASFTRNN